MRILIVGGNPNGVCGSAIAVKYIIRSLAKTNDVYMFPILPVFQKKSFESNDNFIIVKKKLSIDILKYCIRNSINWLKVVLPYLKFSPRGLAYYFITLFYNALIKREIKTIKPDIIHIHNLAIECLPFIEASIDNKIPFVVTAHGIYSLDQNIWLWFNKDLEKDILLRLAKHEVLITTVSSSVRDSIVSNFGIPINAIKVVHNGVDFKKFGSQNISKNELRDRYHIRQDKIMLLQVGTLNKRKNHIAILQAIASMNSSLKEKLLYLVVGDGKEKRRLLNFVKEKGLTKYVLFTGRVPDEKLRDMYHLSDFFILPSTSEGLPLVFLEAIAAGIPIITFSDLKGAKDIYKPFCMELIPERSVESIINSVNRAIDRNWDKQQIVDYAKNWDWESVCEKYKSCYNEAISFTGPKNVSERDSE